jgi:hypothetical protein
MFSPSHPYHRLAAGVRFPELLRLDKPETAQHLVQFYEDDAFLIESVAYLAAKALSAGSSSVIVATESHQQQIGERLVRSELEFEAFRESGRYVTYNAAEALSQLMIDGHPNATSFDRVIGRLMRNAAKKSANGFVFAFGEMVALLCAAGNSEGAVRLERLWNGLAHKQRFSLYCAYPLSSLCTECNADALLEICAEHALTIPSESSI